MFMRYLKIRPFLCQGDNVFSFVGTNLLCHSEAPKNLLLFNDLDPSYVRVTTPFLYAQLVDS
jgi:hypothetical protein